MSLSPRFITNALLALAGGFLVVISFAFSAPVVGWITFAVALGILVVLAGSQLDRSRGIPQQALDVPPTVLAVWTVIASVVFAGSTLTWLSFAEGLGFAGLALIGLVMHELLTERVVHSLAIEDRESRGVEHYADAA